MSWGEDYYRRQATPPDGNDYMAIAAGAWHSLALKSDGSIVGWGNNDFGQATPPAGNDYVATASGYWHSLALKSDGSIAGWGYDANGQATPPDGNDYVGIAAGWYHSLALRADGSIAGWGDTVAPPAGNDYVGIAAGGSHSLALKSDGAIVGWGRDHYGQATPPDGNDYVAIAAGGYHSLALKSDGSIVGWGYDKYGQATPPDGNDYVAIAAGKYHSVALRCSIRGDFDTDGDVDFRDYALFAAGWDVNNSMTIRRGAVVVDGNLGEWSQGVEWVRLDKVYYGSPNDVSEAWFALKWDANTSKIYAAVLAYDGDHVFSDEYTSWDASDRIEIYSQGDAEGGTGWVRDYNMAQHYMVGPNTAGGFWGAWAYGEPLAGDEGLEYAVVVDGELIAYEVAVKQFDNYGGFTGGETIVTDLEVGHVVGFDLIVSSRWLEGFGMLAENLMNDKYLDADQFAKYMLVGAHGGPPCLKLWASDLDGNCVINWADLAVLADNWLWGK
ncbi:MAG: RCC1 domain-containing protein [Planctomycetota bacterium]|jgi:hypothetical protein